MKPIAIAFSFICLALIDGRPAAAQEYPWCLQSTEMQFGGENCGFASFQQCMATQYGRGGICVRNTRYVAPPPAEPRPRSRPRREQR